MTHPIPPRPCANPECENIARYNKIGLCDPCYAYWRTHGKYRIPRPHTIYQSSDACSVCQAPYAGPGSMLKGMCRPCGEYFQRTGKYPSEKLLQRRRQKQAITPVHILCDCGQPATHTVSLQVKSGMEEYHLCDDCYRLEMEN